MTRPFGRPLRKGTIVLRNATAAQWTSANPTLLAGEAGYESDTGLLKFGNGSTAWSSLEYANQLGGWRAFIRQRADRAALANNTNAQAIFDATTNGSLAVPTGTYLFSAGLYVTGMSATSGNARFNPIGNGTAAVAANEILYFASGTDTNTPTNAGAQVGSMSNTPDSPASLLVAAVGTAIGAQVTGLMDINTAGTIIPTLALVTAVGTATPKKGCYFWAQRIGATGTAQVGGWT